MWPCLITCLQPARLKRETTGVKVSLAMSVRCIQNKNQKASEAVRTKQISALGVFWLFPDRKSEYSTSCIKFCFNEFRNVEH